MTAELPLLTEQQLLAAERALQPPFLVDVQTGSGPERLQVLDVLRLLPGRRLAARALLAGASGAAATPVMLKLFFGDGAVGYCERERQGYAHLQDANLPTPECLADGDTVLLYRWLNDADTISENSAEQLDLTVELVGRLHGAKLLQTDMHLENFLWHENRVWLVDPDGIRPGRADPGVYRDNLAVLFAQLAPPQDIQLAPRLMRYCHGADLVVDGGAARRLSAQLPDAVERARSARVDRYLDKTMRDCTEFLAQHSGGRRFLCVREQYNAELAAFCQDPELALENATVIKAGNTATVLRMSLAGQTCIVKRYNVKSPLHRLRQSLRPKSRAERAWRNGHRLRFLRIATAAPIALLELRQYGMRDVAYLVTEDLGAVDLLDELKQTPLSPRRLQQIVALFESLKLARLSHGDTKATNLLVHQDELYLIDLDSMQPANMGFDRDRARFVANWPVDSAIGQQVRARLGL